MSSSSFSIAAVKSKSTSRGKWPSSSPTTAKARNDGIRAWPRLNTYPRSWIVCMIDAYVDGRPMPSSSIALTSDGSV